MIAKIKKLSANLSKVQSRWAPNEDCIFFLTASSPSAQSKIRDKLDGAWYSTKEKNDLFWEHEWKKHGSCMFNECDELSYFTTTLELYYRAIEKDLPDKYYNSLSKRCLIPVNLNFEFI